MDAVQEHAAKRRKTTSRSSVLPEIRNALYEYAALPNNVEPDQRRFVVIAEDGSLSTLDAVHLFFLDHITDSGQSALFAKNIVKVAELTQEVLTLVMPKILFKVQNPLALDVFAETFAAHLSVCEIQPELHVELDFSQDMDEFERKELEKWESCVDPHGRSVNMHDHTEKWARSISQLPAGTNLHLKFSTIWRDFRELRGLSKKYGFSKYNITFQFPSKSLEDEKFDFFKLQTMAAVRDVEIKEQIGICESRRVELVKMGCRGFNALGRRPDEEDSGV